MTKSGQGQAHSFGICSVDSVGQSSGLQDLFAKRGQDELARNRRGATGTHRRGATAMVQARGDTCRNQGSSSGNQKERLSTRNREAIGLGEMGEIRGR